MRQLATEAVHERVLVLAPLGRDASLMCRTLARTGLACVVCAEADLGAQLRAGAGALLLTEEALTPQTVAVLKSVTEAQPGWSDLPLVLLVNAPWRGLKVLTFADKATLTATILERPTRIPTLISVVRTALTARRRQYQVRDLLAQQAEINAQLGRWVDDRTSDLRAANAQLTAEIAEHERAERELLESERRFEKAFRVGPVAASITTLGEGRFIDVNESFETLTGYAREEVVGQTEQVLAIWDSADDPTETAQQGGSYHDLELHVKTKEGRFRDILCSGEAITVGDSPCLLRMFYDITERKQTEEMMLQAINDVMQDTAWFSRSLMEKLAQVKSRRSDQDTNTREIAELTKREKQVLEQIARGHNNAAIAAKLGLAEQTVRNYITNLYDKIGVRSRAEAVVWARERGLATF